MIKSVEMDKVNMDLNLRENWYRQNLLAATSIAQERTLSSLEIIFLEPIWQLQRSKTLQKVPDALVIQAQSVWKFSALSQFSQMQDKDDHKESRIEIISPPGFD